MEPRFLCEVHGRKRLTVVFTCQVSWLHRLLFSYTVLSILARFLTRAQAHAYHEAGWSHELVLRLSDGVCLFVWRPARAKMPARLGLVGERVMSGLRLQPLDVFLALFAFKAL